MQKAIALIEEFEGFSATPYLCPAGVPTIGFGDTTWNGKPVSMQQKPITRAQAEEALKKRLAVFQAQLDDCVTMPLNTNQNDALLSFIYNIGIGAFKGSTMRRKLNRGQYALAADEFDKWNRGGGKVLDGLKRRRAAEKQLFLEA